MASSNVSRQTFLQSRGLIFVLNFINVYHTGAVPTYVPTVETYEMGYEGIIALVKAKGMDRIRTADTKFRSRKHSPYGGSITVWFGLVSV